MYKQNKQKNSKDYFDGHHGDHDRCDCCDKYLGYDGSAIAEGRKSDLLMSKAMHHGRHRRHDHRRHHGHSENYEPHNKKLNHYGDQASEDDQYKGFQVVKQPDTKIMINSGTGADGSYASLAKAYRKCEDEMILRYCPY